MTQNAVLGSSSDPTFEPPSRPVPPDALVPDQVDPDLLLSALLLPTADLPRRPRPFDAQYWACWFASGVGMLLLAYLVLVR